MALSLYFNPNATQAAIAAFGAAAVPAVAHKLARGITHLAQNAFDRLRERLGCHRPRPEITAKYKELVDKHQAHGPVSMVKLGNSKHLVTWVAPVDGLEDLKTMKYYGQIFDQNARKIGDRMHLATHSPVIEPVETVLVPTPEGGFVFAHTGTNPDAMPNQRIDVYTYSREMSPLGHHTVQTQTTGNLRPQLRLTRGSVVVTWLDRGAELSHTLSV